MMLILFIINYLFIFDTHYNISKLLQLNIIITFCGSTCFVLHIPLGAAHNLQEMIYLSLFPHSDMYFIVYMIQINIV